MKQHTDQQVLRKIAILQGVQKTNPPQSAEWQEASKQLAPLFAEMAARTSN